MKSQINAILSEIDKKRSELKTEYWKLKVKYGFTFKNGRVVFNSNVIKANKRQRKSVLKTIFTAEVREILSFPFIWMMLIPAIILDVCLFIYQNTAIRLYWIPLAKRSDYIIFDRQELDYLNFIQKINCIFCSYVNWLFSYAIEIAWRTEKYWCPIKNAKKSLWWHDWEKYFADYWDAEWFKETLSNRGVYNKK